MTEADTGPWAADAVRRVRGEGRTDAPTPLRRLPMPAAHGTDVLLEDESARPTGSLEHRLVRALSCHAMTSGGVTADTPVVAASGSAPGSVSVRLCV